MNTRKWLTGLVIILLGLVLAACSANTNKPHEEAASVQLEFTYADVSFEERMQQAQVVLAGKVLSISPTKWNQDSGDYWEEEIDGTLYSALPYYEIEVSTEQLLSPSEGIGQSLIITVLGTAPHETGVAAADGLAVISDSNLPLAIGDEVVIFVRQTDLAWRDGSRAVWYFMGDPVQSFMKMGKDGLYTVPGSGQKGITITEIAAALDKK